MQLKELVDMKISEIKSLESIGSDSVFVLRVYNGWIYNIYTNKGMNSVFVPEQSDCEVQNNY